VEAGEILEINLELIFCYS